MDDLKETPRLPELYASVLRYHEPILVKEMNVMITLRELVNQSVFTEEEEKVVCDEVNLMGRAKQIINILKTKDEVSFNTFVGILRNTNQENLATKLLEDIAQGGSLPCPTQIEEDRALMSSSDSMDCDSEMSTRSFSFKVNVDADSMTQDEAGVTTVGTTWSMESNASDESKKEGVKLPQQEAGSNKSSKPTAGPSFIQEATSASSLAVSPQKDKQLVYQPDLAIIDLPVDVRQELVDALSLERPNGKDWRILARYTKCTPQNIALLKQNHVHKNAAEQILRDWEVSNDATVGKLCEILENNDMGQIAKILKMPVP